MRGVGWVSCMSCIENVIAPLTDVKTIIRPLPNQVASLARLLQTLVICCKNCKLDFLGFVSQSWKFSTKKNRRVQLFANFQTRFNTYKGSKRWGENLATNYIHTLSQLIDLPSLFDDASLSFSNSPKPFRNERDWIWYSCRPSHFVCGWQLFKIEVGIKETRKKEKQRRKDNEGSEKSRRKSKWERVDESTSETGRTWLLRDRRRRLWSELD